MRTILSALALFFCALTSALAIDDYKLGPDSKPQDGTPRGEVTRYHWVSKIFPATERDYWVYVPNQYEAGRPACLMVFQDGGGFQTREGTYRVPVVMDNLIHKKQMPVTIALFVDPGVVPALHEKQWPRFNRSYEYDTASSQYAKFLIDEIIPEVAAKYTLTSKAEERAIGGASSGGIAALTAAWERPDYFSKVISFVGSFTDLRGGNSYPGLIRKSEPKPIRVFLQDGTNDQNIYAGSWFLGNQEVAEALKFAGYDYEFVTGDGRHSGLHGGAILPDALRWIWRDVTR